MKRILSYITTGLGAVILFAGCVADNASEILQSGDGYLVFTTDFGGATRAEAVVAPESYTVKIGTASGYTHIFSNGDAPSELKLASGSYFIEVEAGTPPEGAGWAEWEEDPSEILCYYGRADFVIRKNEKTPVNVECDPLNTFFTIDFAESVTDVLTGYKVTIYPDPADETKTLVFDEDNSGATANMILAEGQKTMDWAFEATYKGDPIEKEGTFEDLKPGKSYSVTFKYTEKTGKFSITVTVNENTTDITHPIPITPGGRVAANPVSGLAAVWAGHANVTGVAAEGADVSFEYHPAEGTRAEDGWKSVPATEDKDAPGTYSAILIGLDPGTKYEVFIAVDGEPAGKPQYFTTEAAPVLTNGNFEDWVKDGNSWFPGTAKANLFWDTANRGLATATGDDNKNPTIPDSDKRPGSTGTQSAFMRSKYVHVLIMDKFAAGNLFTGEFNGISISPAGGKVDFGRPFTGRPSALKGWLKANAGIITHNESGSPKNIGDPDEYQIYACLTTWDAWHRVNTWDPKTFMDFTADDIVAYGEKSGTGYVDWTEFEIPLKYKHTDRTPKYLLIVASSSKYGDYLTGSTDSWLKVDDFELVYDENIVTQDEEEK